MKLNTFAGWAGYGLFVLAIASLGIFLAAAGYGYGTLAIVAGCICVVAIACAMGLVGGVIKHDHTVHRQTPRLL